MLFQGFYTSFICNKNKAYCHQLFLLLNFYPRNVEIYKIAFRHSSQSFIENGKQINNERLEFVGDAILDAIVADILFVNFPELNEGKLTLMRSQIVKRKSLDNLAIKIGLSDFIIYKNGNNTTLSHIAGNAFEALIGAIYYDKGFNYCKRFVEKVINEHFNLKQLIEENEDYKSLLLNLANKNKWNIVFDTFENIEENEKDIHYQCSIIINNKFIIDGKAWSKKDAEQKASENALKSLSKK